MITLYCEGLMSTVASTNEKTGTVELLLQLDQEDLLKLQEYAAKHTRLRVALTFKD